MTRIRTRLLFCLLLPLLGSTAGPPALGQAFGETPPAAEPQVPQEVLDRMLRAREKMTTEDLTGAIAELEPLVGRPDVPLPAMALLGALYLETGEAEKALGVLAPTAEATEEPAVLYQAARAARALGRMEEFERYLERSVAREPATPAARELGLLRAGQGRCVEAYDALGPWVALRPDDTEARTAAALCAVNLERLADAETLLSDLDQSDPRIRLLWGRLRILREDPRGAISTLRPLLDLEDNPVEPEARRLLAEAHVDLGESTEAVSVLEGHTEGRPLLALRLAQARYQGGDLEGAIATLAPWSTQLRAPEPSIDPRLLAEMAREYGRFLTARGAHEEAVPYLERATNLSPEDKQSWQALGQALAAVGRIDEAKEALARFSELTEQAAADSARPAGTGRSTDRILADAVDAMNDGRFEQAITMLEEESARSPEDPRPTIYLSRALLLAGRNEAALQTAEEALERAPENADALYQRGTVRLARREMQAAERDLRLAIQRAPGHTPAMNDLAVLLMTTERNDEARELLERVLELRPSDPQAQANLDRLAGEEG